MGKKQKPNVKVEKVGNDLVVTLQPMFGGQVRPQAPIVLDASDRPAVRQAIIDHISDFRVKRGLRGK